MSGARVYGGNKTLHRTKALDVSTNKNGRVVSVWFRCQLLPFNQNIVDDDRVKEMDAAYKRELPDIEMVVLKNKEANTA